MSEVKVAVNATARLGGHVHCAKVVKQRFKKCSSFYIRLNSYYCDHSSGIKGNLICVTDILHLDIHVHFL